MQAKIFYSIVVSFACGVGIQTIGEYPFEVGLWFLLVGFVLAWLWRRKSSAFSAPILLLSSIIFVGVAVGMVRTEVASWQFNKSTLEELVGEEVNVTGVVTSEPEYRERTVQLHIQTDADKVLVSTDRLSDVSYGDLVSVTGTLKRPEVFTTDLGREFDYPRYLKVRKVEYTVPFAQVDVIGQGHGNSLLSVLLQIKSQFVGSIVSVIPEPEAGLASGLLLGIKSALGHDIEQAFRQTGIIHIVVLSGYNVMLVVAFILFTFSFLFSFRGRVVAGIIAIVAFALIVGLSATVVRASIMAVIVLLAQVLGRRYNVLRALCFAGLIMIVSNPYILLYDIGFQLSFMATLGLILIIPQFESTVMRSSRLLGLRDFFLATLATQLAVLPLLMYHIGEVSLIAVLVNILILPMVPLAMLLSFLTGLITFISSVGASLVGYVATFSLTYMIFVAQKFSTLPFATILVPEFSVWEVGVMYIFIGLALWYAYKNRAPRHKITADWVIETEAVVQPIRNQTSGLAVTSDTPVFFR